MNLLSVVPIKFGGSILTDKSTDRGLRRWRVRKAAALVAGLRDAKGPKPIILLGGGSIAHRHAERLGLVRGAVELHRIHNMSQAMFDLKCAFAAALDRLGVAALPFHETSCLVEQGGAWSLSAEPIYRCIASGAVPILSGGPVFTGDGRIVAFSSDEYAHVLLASGRFNISRFVMIGDTPGVIGRNGAPIATLTRDNLAEVAKLDLHPGVVDISGDMEGKIQIALDLAERGVETTICGLREMNGERFAGLVAGTTVMATRIPAINLV